MLNINFNSYKHLIIFVIFLSILVFGLVSVKDFGVSSDELDQRHSGFIELNYIGEKLIPNILEYYKGDREYIDLNDENYLERFSGHFLNTVSAFLEVIFNIEDIRNVLIFKHYIYFTIFFLSLISFYKICQIRFEKWYISIIGVLIIFLSPRILANSFYDPKDIPFLSILIFSLHFGLVFFNKLNFRNMFYFAVFNALVISGVRIYGVISPILIILSILFYNFLNKKNLKKELIFVLYSILLTLFFSIIIKPNLWENPISNFINSFKYLTEFGQVWVVPNLFFGEIVLAKDVPWFYSIVWISITTPIFYLILFIIGILLYLKNFFQYFVKNFLNKNFYFDTIFFSIIFIPLVGSIILRESSFNSWRHLYFIYPYFVIFCLIAIDLIIDFLKKNSLSSYFYYLIIINLVINANWIIKNHPFQYSYFNILAGKNLNQKFDIDYWGLSFKQNLEYILDNDERKKITIVSNSINKPALFKNSLSKNNRKRFIFDQKNPNPDYIITNFFLDDINKYRIFDDEFIEKEYFVFSEILVDGESINTVFKKK